MNREILFKAKRKDNGEWVEGDLLHTRHADVVLISDFEDQLFRCDGNTLCQYTGLADKNGKKIWENDIISIHAYSYYEPEDDYFGAVKYSLKDACWCLCSEVADIICECFGSYTTEIKKYGNIFDNPELLEAER